MFDWTEPRLDDLRRHWADGMPCVGIAERLGCTKNAVIGKANRLNLTCRTVVAKAWSKGDEDTLRSLWDEGKTGSFIGGLLGFTKSAVLKKARRLNLSKRMNTGGRGRSTKSKRPMQPRLSPFQRILAGQARPELAASTELDIPIEQQRTFIELAPHHCRWPIGDGPFMFCGGDRVEGRPYCFGHCRIAYRKDTNARQPFRHKRGVAA